MKTLVVFLWVAVLCGGTAVGAHAQKPAGNLEVSAVLNETSGTYDARKLCRRFLEQYMKDCPYVKEFSVEEVPGASDNHEVIWHYRVDNWNEITQFYGWLGREIKSTGQGGIKMALSSYGPQYQLGGKISVTKWKRSMLAKH